MPEEAITETPETAPETATAKPSFFEVLERELPGGTAPEAKEPVVTPEARPDEAKPDDKAPAKSDGRAPSELFKKPDEAAAAPVSEFDKIADTIKGKNEQERVSIGILRTRGNEFEAKARALEAKIAEAELKGKNTEALATRLKETEAKLAEVDAIASRANAEARPEFREKFVTGREKIVSEIEQLIANSGGESKGIAAALALKGKVREDALAEATDGLPAYRAAILGAKIEKLDALDAEAESIRANSKEYWKEVQQREKQQADEEQKALIKDVHESFEHSRRSLAAELEVLQPLKGEGMEWWNEQAKGIVERAGKKFKEEWTVKTAADAAIWKEAGPVYRELFQKEREYSEAEIPKRDKEIAELKAELEGIYNKSPKILAGGSDANATKKKGFFDILSEQLPGGD